MWLGVLITSSSLLPYSQYHKLLTANLVGLLHQRPGSEVVRPDCCTKMMYCLLFG
ncbi:hypothetical protein ACLB1R_00340 [Escherichia coli]